LSRNISLLKDFKISKIFYKKIRWKKNTIEIGLKEN
jgi:hypothetical protein